MRLAVWYQHLEACRSSELVAVADSGQNMADALGATLLGFLSVTLFPESVYVPGEVIVLGNLQYAFSVADLFGRRHGGTAVRLRLGGDRWGQTIL